MARNLNAEITNRILEQLKAGTVPWRKPWSEQASGAMPRNAMSGRAYSGVNVILLWATAQERSYSSPRWLTFKQALEAGGNVRKGEKGTTVIFVSTFERQNKETGKLENIPFLKSFSVFNVCQCENLPDNLSPPVHIINQDRREELADEFMTATGADIRHGEGRAYFRPSGDFINLPHFETFTAAGTYYATAFHELTHWTGAEARLDRKIHNRFGDAGYSAEELVAELGSAFLCAEFGFDNEGQDAAYIAHWITFLTDHEGAIVAAASAASKATEYLRGLAEVWAAEAAEHGSVPRELEAA